MSRPPAAGCVYCGLPRARVAAAGREPVELPACVAHSDLLELDPAFNLDGNLAVAIPPELASKSVLDARSRESAQTEPPRALAAPSTSSPPSSSGRPRGRRGVPP